MRFSLALLAVAPVAAALLPFPASGQFSARPVLLTFGADSAEVRTVTVRNESRQPVQLGLYAGDFDQDVAGRHAFSELGSHARSCASRIRVWPSDVVLEAGASSDVRIEMSPGDRTCWSVVFAESRTVERGGYTVGRRIGIKTYGLGTDRVREARMSEVAATHEEDGLRVDFVVENVGTVPFRPEGDLEIRTLEGEVRESTAVPSFSVLPGHRRRVSVTLEDRRPEGRYLAVPVLDVGTDYLVGGQALFRQAPAGAVAVQDPSSDVDPAETGGG